MTNCQDFNIRYGQSQLNSDNAVSRNVVEMHQHPKFQQDAKRYHYDVGIAVVDRHIEFNENVRPICLPMNPIDDDDFLADQVVFLAQAVLPLLTERLSNTL